MKNRMSWKVRVLLCLIASSSAFSFALSSASARSVRTPEGNMPMVHWAILESTPGNMKAMGEIAAKTVGPQAAQEAGTYMLYGGVDESNRDVMRLLEIYEGYEAYRIHSTSEAFQDYRAARFPILKSLRILEVNGIVLEQKEEGVATVVVMRRYEVAPEKLWDYQRLAKSEAVRAVDEDEGVMGIFVTAEHDNPNIIHTMELYRDQEARERYMESESYRAFSEKATPMFLDARTIENLPANITLSAKGLKKD